jgi:ATP-dependent RNA helicase DDX43
MKRFLSPQNGQRSVEVQGDDQNIQSAIDSINKIAQGGYSQNDGGGSQYQSHNAGYSQGSYGNQQRTDTRYNDNYSSMNNSNWNRGNNSSNGQQQRAADNWDRPRNVASYSNQSARYDDHQAQSMKSNETWTKAEMTSQFQPSLNSYNSSSQSSSNNWQQKDRGGYGNRSSYSNDNGRYSRPRQDNYSSGQSSYNNNNSNAETSNELPAVIDWAKANAECEAARKARWANCPVMIKSFFKEHPATTEMTQEEVERFRLENNKIAVAKVFDENAAQEEMPKPTVTFEYAFEDYPDLLETVKKQGFAKPSPIQSQMWPILLRGEDCIGISQTGSGKTLAFLLPALIHTDGQPHARGIAARGGPNVLVLAPTRELAVQIEKEVAKYQYRGIRAVCLYGGNDRKKQIEIVEAGCEIIIATPGRLNDLVAGNHVKIESITYLVLDEADRMLDMVSTLIINFLEPSSYVTLL